MNAFIWGAVFGYLAACGVNAARDVLRTWRETKAEVNEVRRQHGIQPQRRWWRL